MFVPHFESTFYKFFGPVIAEFDCNNRFSSSQSTCSWFDIFVNLFTLTFDVLYCLVIIIEMLFRRGMSLWLKSQFCLSSVVLQRVNRAKMNWINPTRSFRRKRKAMWRRWKAMVSGVAQASLLVSDAFVVTMKLLIWSPLVHFLFTTSRNLFFSDWSILFSFNIASMRQDIRSRQWFTHECSIVTCTCNEKKE